MSRTILRTNVLVALLSVLLIAHATTVLAACDPNCDPKSFQCTDPCSLEQTGTPTTTPAKPPTAAPADTGRIAPIELENPLGTDDVRVVIARFIQLLTGISGSIALAAFVYGGFQWVTSAGDPAKVEAGKKTFKSAVYGLVMIFGAYIAVRAVFTLLGGPLAS